MYRPHLISQVEEEAQGIKLRLESKLHSPFSAMFLIKPDEREDFIKEINRSSSDLSSLIGRTVLLDVNGNEVVALTTQGLGYTYSNGYSDK